MQLERVFVFELFVAARAGVNDVPVVNGTVSRERTRNTETAPALPANIRLFTGVNSLVYFSIDAPVEALVAPRTRVVVRVSMRALVLPEPARISKPHQAFLTRIHLHSSVTFFVVSEVRQ